MTNHWKNTQTEQTRVKATVTLSARGLDVVAITTYLIWPSWSALVVWGRCVRKAVWDNLLATLFMEENEQLFLYIIRQRVYTSSILCLLLRFSFPFSCHFKCLNSPELLRHPDFPISGVGTAGQSLESHCHWERWNGALRLDPHSRQIAHLHNDAVEWPAHSSSGMSFPAPHYHCTGLDLSHEVREEVILPCFN